MSEGERTVDPRIAARRRRVREASARRRLRWVVGGIMVLLLGGLVVAVLQSPWLAVSEIRIEGARVSDVGGILRHAGVEEGVAMISVRAGTVEDALLEDPWIARAEVRVTWPREIDVVVLEHEPLAWLSGSPGTIVAQGGAVLSTADAAGDLPVITADAGTLTAGDQIEDAATAAALEFIARLPEELRHGVTMQVRTSSLTATVAGHAVELGSPVDMGEKALALAAVLGDGIPDGATVNLVSPTRPAVANPQPLVESRHEGDTDAETPS
jgi:cell division septal protein FtsQ